MKTLSKLKYIESRIQKSLFSLILLYLDPRTFGVTFRQPKSLKEIEVMFQLRFKVYCEENNFLPKEKYINGQETDIYDEHSDYVLAITLTGRIIGCVRLIKPTIRSFPTESEFGLCLDRRESTVEISRLIVEKKYRSTKVGIGLYRGIYQRCVRLGFTYVLEAMEEPLAKWINYLFLEFKPVSEEKVYFHTINRAFIADVYSVSESVRKDNFFLHTFLEFGLSG